MNMNQSELPFSQLSSKDPSSPDLSLRMMTRMMIFFSEIATSATHDMKNYLAIINENAGLLDDLAQMDVRDLASPLTPDRVSHATEKIKNQIERTDQILKKLNRFSRDLAPEKAVTDLETALGLVLDLSAGIIRNHAAQVNILPPEKKIYLDSPPFLLSLLLFRAIQTCLDGADGSKEVTISFERLETTTRLCFTANRIKSGGMDDLFSASEEEELSTLLSVKVNRNIENGFALEWRKTGT